MRERTTFEFGQVLKETQQLKDDLHEIATRQNDARVIALLGEIADVRVVGEGQEDPPLAIALVGQYGAGKSTIVRVLTGREDILIDSNVSTASVDSYDWNGVRLLDTPGIHAGFPEHDEATYAAIDRADLLVFVISNELFDDTIGKQHFRELAFARQHAHEMILVVNKMGQDPGTPSAKCGDIEKVTAPLRASDFRTVFIDARSWLEAQCTDDELDRADLLAIANVGDLVAALNAFIAERGLAGRLTAPLFTLRGLGEQVRALISTDFPEERAALELLHRKRSLFLASRVRLASAMNGVVARAVSDICMYGDQVAETIEPGKTEKEVEALHQQAQRKASSRSDALATVARACVESELTELRRQLEALRNGVLARELRGKVDRDASSERVGDFDTPSWSARPKEHVPSDWPTKAKKIGDIANGIGSWAAKWAAGPLAKATVGSASAARGSQAHQVVYNVGKFFGVKFKPWGAVKVARAIGNVGRVIAAVGGVLAVVAQVAEDRQNEKQRLALRDARDGVRAAYRESAHAVRDAVRIQFESFLSDFYGSELSAIDDEVEDLVGKRSVRSESVEALAQITERATNLIDRVQSMGAAQGSVRSTV